jgi:Domain of unknown function (DUF4349)
LSPDLATALRTETPGAPDRLRERVAQIAAVPPPTRPRLSLRRVVLVGAPAIGIASLVAAVAVGVRTAAVSEPQPEARSLVRTAPEARALVPIAPAAPDVESGSGAISPAPSAQLRAPSRLDAAVPPAPNGDRAQDVHASLTVLVDGTEDLSATTQRALRVTRRLGGYVVNVQYGTPEPTEGTAALRVRIPVSRVQAAVVQFSDLGRILAQQVQISDLQQPLDELTRRIRRLERLAANAQGAELARIKSEIAALRRQRAEVNRRAAFATVSLDLTTHEPQKQEAAPGRLERAIDDATGVLAAELAIGAYALIVAAPILLLFAAAFAASRAYRRFADQRLLERA